MRRRLIVVILAVVLATLVVVGGGTLLVSGVRARATTGAELRSQARELADAAAETLTAGLDDADDAVAQRTITRRLTSLRRFARLLELDDVSVVVADRRGLRGEIPAGIDPAALDLAQLRNGDVVSGDVGRAVWAAAATEEGPRGRFLVVVVQRTVAGGLADGSRWFVIAAVATLALGVVAAVALADRLSRPIRTASAATRRIADGDLAARVEEDDGADELAELARSVNAMAAALERSRGLEQEFLLSVSHDLRTPLTSIRGYAEAIVDGAASGERSAPVILAEAQRLERLVADLLELARLRSTGFRLAPTPFDLPAMVRSAVDGFGPSATERGITIGVAAAPPLTIEADRDRLGQVLANLLENAAKYARTVVTVTIEHRGDRVQLLVDDDGPGISAADAPYVFDRLYVSRREPQRRENGSGVGLAIVRELVTAMQGSVGVAGNPTGGARVIVELPLVQSGR